MTEQRSGGIAEGIRTGIGMLAAFKDALEETLDEAIARGDLSPERAKNVVRDTASRVQSTLGEARERLEIVSRKEFDALRREVEELRARVDRAEGLSPSPGAGDTASEARTGGVPID